MAVVAVAEHLAAAAAAVKRSRLENEFVVGQFAVPIAAAVVQHRLAASVALVKDRDLRSPPSV